MLTENSSNFKYFSYFFGSKNWSKYICKFKMLKKNPFITIINHLNALTYFQN